MLNRIQIDLSKRLKTSSIVDFAFSQFVSYILLNSKTFKSDRTNLISLVKESQIDIELITEFEANYTSERALWWYTRMTCFDRIINEAIQTQDISQLIFFEFFVQDVHKQLLDCRCQTNVRVYRSQLMTNDEIESWKQMIGCFMSIHKFFSTMIDRDRTLDFLKSSMISNEIQRVFFEIDADPSISKSKPFGEITSKSYYPNDREILFSIGSIFRVIDIYLNDEQIWIIQLALCCDEESNLKPFFQQIESQYGATKEGDMVFIAFSRLLREMGKFDDAEMFCHRLFKQFASNELLLNIVYDELAQTTTCSNTFRFMDLVEEKHEILLPIEGYEKMPLVSLEEATQSLIPILPDIRRKVHTAKLKCKYPADGLTIDESAAIMLYTMEWEPNNQCLYFALNAALRAADRHNLKPWFSYLKLMLTGLSRLPSTERTVYRGVRLDLSADHKEDDEFFWWGFSSCTSSLNVLKSDQYLGENGTRTLFNIECTNGKDIRRHSYYKKEDEILLLPASFFKVITCFHLASDLHMIQLREIKPEFPYLESCCFIK